MHISGFSLPQARWSFRGLVLGSVKREFTGKYRESLLGVFWSVAHPLSLILLLPGCWIFPSRAGEMVDEL